MSNTKIVCRYLKDYAENNNYKVFTSKYGDITFNNNTNKFSIILNAGSVYGIWVNLNDNEKIELWNEAGGQRTLNCINDFRMIEGNWYPLYWGKEIKSADRIFAHIKGHKKNGNINMPQYPVLRKVKIVYGSITVERYADFERDIMNTAPPLLGTRRNGKSTTTAF